MGSRVAHLLDSWHMLLGLLPIVGAVFVLSMCVLRRHRTSTNVKVLVNKSTSTVSIAPKTPKTSRSNSTTSVPPSPSPKLRVSTSTTIESSSSSGSNSANAFTLSRDASKQDVLTTTPSELILPINLPPLSHTPVLPASPPSQYNLKFLPRLSLPSIPEAATRTNSRLSSTSPQPQPHSLSPSTKLVQPDTPPSILVTNTDSPSFNLAHQRFVLGGPNNPFVVHTSDPVLATLLGDVFLTKVTRIVEIGTDSVGKIFKGTWQGAPVVLRPILTEKMKQLRNDIIILKNLRHPNIVTFFGLYQIQDEQIHVVTEFVEHGFLRDFLRSHSPQYIDKQQMILYQQNKEAKKRQEAKDHLHNPHHHQHFTVTNSEFKEMLDASKEKKHSLQSSWGSTITTTKQMTSTALPHSRSHNEINSTYQTPPNAFSSPNLATLTSRDLVKLSRDIAAGMMQLEQKSFAHRNLTANSVVVGGTLPNKLIAKISDFGLTRHTNTEPSPRYTSPEAYKSKKFTSRSDLWSYGVCLYEIFSYGKIPYDGLPDDRVINWVLEGNRLPFDSNTPPLIQTIAYRCWDINIAKRPTFDEIFELLDNYLQSPQFHGYDG